MTWLFGQAPDSLRNHLSTDELGRIVIASLVNAAVMLLACRWVLPMYSADASLSAWIITMVFETGRRLDHGRRVD